jgi:arylsulfatase A-like enzyme
MGKWHLGTETYYYPEHQGFDVNIAGRDYGAPGSYFYPFTGKWRIPSTGKTLHKKKPLSGKKGDYLADRLAAEAEGFIRSNAEKPFFSYAISLRRPYAAAGKAKKGCQVRGGFEAQATGKACLCCYGRKCR